MKKSQQEHKAQILKGFAHPVRLSIVELLAEKELCVKEIADLYPFDRTTISKHLAQLKKLNILEGVRDGLNIYYHLKMSGIPSLLQMLDTTSEEQVMETADNGISYPSEWRMAQKVSDEAAKTAQ